MEVATRRLMRYSLADMDSWILSGPDVLLSGSRGGSPSAFLGFGLLLSVGGLFAVSALSNDVNAKESSDNSSGVSRQDAEKKANRLRAIAFGVVAALGGIFAIASSGVPRLGSIVYGFKNVFVYWILCGAVFALWNKLTTTISLLRNIVNQGKHAESVFAEIQSALDAGDGEEDDVDNKHSPIEAVATEEEDTDGD
eukprot:GHVQ01007097.1.p1 GENE.GHVQ01007097.1~~GHVQ01007097.1.p1  ORF type:complete len:196 (+),score=24.74 GHVQ01007097.1:136-723(+)